MTTVRELHSEAMQLAQSAMIARHNGETEQSLALAREACTYETQAADLVPEGELSEPTRSILYRSAASLAFQAKDLVTAQRLLAKGLSGFPPPEIEQELKDLYEEVNLEYHLRIRGVVLEDADVQLSMQGAGVGLG